MGPLRGRNHRRQLAAAPLDEGNSSVFEGEKGVIPAAAHVCAGMYAGSVLADDYRAGFYGGSAKNLDA